MFSGPHWDEKNQVLYYVNCIEKEIVKLCPNSTQEYRSVNLDGKYITVAIPFSNHTEQFIVSVDNRLIRLDWATGNTEELYEMNDGVCWFNDAKCDSRGRLWIGAWKAKENFSEDDIFNSVEEGKGSLGCFSCGNLEKKIVGITGPNGLSFSPDERKLYHVDCIEHNIGIHDFDAANGILG